MKPKITFNLEQSEKEEIKQAASRKGLKPAAFCRFAALEKARKILNNEVENS